MSSDADKLWNDLVPKYRRKKDLCRITPEEGEKAFKDAPRAPMSEEEIRAIVNNVVTGRPPKTDEQEPMWYEDEDFGEIDAELQVLHRNQGDTDPASEEAERKLREQMLNDDEDGLEDETETP